MPSWEESEVSFLNQDGHRLYGILTKPASGISSKGLILFNTGLNYRVAWHRLNVKIARRLALSGVTTLRFDTHGVGDSEGDLMKKTDIIEHFDAIQTGCFLDDALRAIRFFEDATGIRNPFLAGLCGGAVTALLAAEKLPSVPGVISICGPPTLSRQADLETIRPWNAGIVLSQYAKKIFSPAAWWNFMRGKSEYRTIFLSAKVLFVSRLKRLFFSPLKQDSSGQNPGEKKETSSPVMNPFYRRAFEAYARRGKILLIFAEHDKATYEFEDYRKAFLPKVDLPAPPREAGIPGWEVHVIKNANHAFHMEESQESLFSLMENFLGSF